MEAEASRPQLKCAVGGGEVVGWGGGGGGGRGGGGGQRSSLEAAVAGGGEGEPMYVRKNKSWYQGRPQGGI